MILIPIILPLLAILLGLFKLPLRRVSQGIMLVNLAVCIYLAITYLYSPASLCNCSVTVLTNPNIKLGFGLNDISVVMIMLTATVSVVATFCHYPEKATAQQKRIFTLSLLFLSIAAMGAFLSTNVFFFYAFHELALIPTFLMISLFGRRDRNRFAWLTTVYLAIGSIILLAGLIGLTSITGTYELVELKPALESKLSSLNGEALATTKAQLFTISILLLIGYGTLVSLFPFHSWAAPAYATAPAPIAMLHAGVLKKFGLYGFIMTAVIVMPTIMQPLVPWIVIMLLCNILWVGLITINQRSIDEMHGYSSVMHMGYIFLALAAFISFPQSQLAIKAATLLMFAHGISIALSFYLTALIEKKTKTLEFNQMGGLAKKAPQLALLYGIAGMASIGLPGLANFSGEIMVFFSGFESWQTDQKFGIIQWATIISIWGVVISAVYFLRAYKDLFHGRLSQFTENATDLSLSEKLPAYLLALTLIVVGVYPNIILQFLQSY